MAPPRLEVADVLRAYGDAYRERYGSALGPEQRRVMRAIELCRTAALGGHVDQCNICGHQVISYNSCRNRHCPKCQALAKAKWLGARRRELLPVDYYHLVLTLPSTLAALARQNKRVVYDILFAAGSQALLLLAGDPRHLGAHIGFMAILHTWGQTLMDHPHLHCLVPGGGLGPDGQRWVACRPGFFLPVRVLSRLFRRLFLDALRKAFEQGRLTFHGQLEPLAAAEAFEQLLRACRRTEWVVYAKPPFAGPERVLDYLARYTHRIAIANHRLVRMEDGNVTFTYRDYNHGGRRRTMTLHAVEFIRRFLLHVLPNGFMRIRYYGFLANRHRAEKLRLCRTLLGVSEAGNQEACEKQDWTRLLQALTGEDPLVCPRCRCGRLVRVEVLPRWPPPHPRAPPGIDRS
jgi:hypothetical protein